MEDFEWDEEKAQANLAKHGVSMATARFQRRRLPKGTTDWKAVDALSDKEVEKRARSDPDGQPLSEADLKRLRRSPRVRILRMALGLTQEEFAVAYGIPLATLRDWEQGRRAPDQATRSFLAVIERIPGAVKRALEQRRGTRARA